MSKKNSILLFVLTVTLAGCTPAAPPKDGQYAELAQCLKEKGVIFYGAYWCPHCKDQKEKFGDDARYLPYFECSPNGPESSSPVCLQAGVKEYPTWFFPGFGNTVGVMEPQILAKKANCEIKTAPAASSEKISPEPVPDQKQKNEIPAESKKNPVSPAKKT